MELVLTRDIDATPAQVWEIACDLTRWPEVISGIERVERLDDGEGFGTGTRWRETRVMFGKEATEELAVTGVDPGRSYTVEADSRGTHYTTVMSVEPVGDGSRLTMTFTGQPTGGASKALAATIGRLFQGATRKALQKDLDDIAAFAEGGADPTASASE